MERLAGYATVVLIGFLPTRELNRISEQVELLDVKKVKEGTSVRVRIEHVNILRHLLRGSKVRMRIVKREGLPFVRVRLRRSMPFFVCLVAAFLVMWGLSQTVMEVSVSGISNEPMKQQLLLMLEESGVKKGVLHQSIDKHAVEERVLELFPDFTFASLRQTGTSLELFVVEAIKQPIVFDKNLPVDLVASAEGLVTTVTVLSGTPLVQPGDTVRQGQVLVSGFDPVKGSMHANGEVYARLWQTGIGEADLFEEMRIPTGNTHKITTLSVFGFTFDFFSEQNPFENYDLVRRGGTLLDGLFIPITWESREYVEVSVEKNARDVSQVRRQAAQRALSDALNLVPNGARIVDKRLEYSKIKGGKLVARLTLETLSQIAVPVQGR